MSAIPFKHMLLFGSASTLEAQTRRLAPRSNTNPFRAPQQSRRPAAKKPEPEQAQKPQRLINWPNVIWLAILHVGCLAAPFIFSWQAVLLTLVLHWITGGIGICLGYHRHFTHTSFTTYRPVRWLLALIDGLGGEGAVTDWVANHRKHHAHS